MKYLLDTDICSYYLRGKYNLEKVFKRKGFQNLRLSVVTQAELKVLAYRNPNSTINLSRISSLSQSLGLLDIDQGTWEIYSKMKADTQTHGRIRGDLDILNASLAKEYSLIVITNNTSHYEDLVQLENWIKN